MNWKRWVVGGFVVGAGWWVTRVDAAVAPTVAVPEPVVTFVTVERPVAVFGLTVVDIPTTTTVPAGDWLCPQWMGLAMKVGWPVEELPKLDRVMFRESSCHPDSFNGSDPNGGSAGLCQTNGVWLNWFLPSLGIATVMDDLFDPATNLRAALAIWRRSGWGPWGG